MVLIGNDDGKKMVEREEAELFLSDYTHATGVQMTLVAVSERPDFVCEKEGKHYGLELVRVMRNPIGRRLEVVFGGDGQLHGQDAADRIQETVYAKEEKRASDGWQYPESTILVVQLVGSDGEELVDYLHDQLMDEMAETGFCEIWIADESTIEPFGTVQLIGVKPDRWRGLHRHSSYGTKPYG
jgi:hypothetical protein